MGGREGLVPKHVTDKNGRPTTVYVRPGASTGTKPIPAIKISVSPAPAKDTAADYINRINGRFLELSGKRFNPLKFKMDEDSYRMIAKLAESPHAGEHMHFVVEGRMNPLGKKELEEWLTVMSRHFDDLMTAGVLRGGYRDAIDAAEFIGAIPRLKYLECKKRGMSFKEYVERVDDEFTPEQELHLAMLSAAAWNSSLTGNRERTNGQHGPTQYVGDQDMLSFAFNGATREQVDAACNIIKGGKVTRFMEVEAIMNGNISPAVADGLL